MIPVVSHSQLQQAKRVLYMSHLAIGDFVYQGVWLQALKHKYPQLSIDIWFDDCRSKPQDWAAGRNKTLTEWIDATEEFDDTYPIVADLEQRAQSIAKAQAKQYDIIVFVGKNRPEKFAKIARQISHSAQIAVTNSKPLSNPIANYMHMKKMDGVISYDNIAAKVSHITELYSQCFNQLLGLETSDLVAGKQQLPLAVKPEYLALVEPTVSKLVAQEQDKKLVFINHLSTASKKDYPWEGVKTLIVELSKQHPTLAFIVNTPPDKLDEVEQAIAQDGDLSNLAVCASTAKTNFFELPALMSLCSLVITVDTATAHLALSLDVPQVTIMASDFKLWQPQGNSIILEGNGKARQVAVKDVIAAANQQLSAII
ncbi:lipopolysaccharide heptosyltransferase family protein [Shewanella maritima]|uniref:Lipopolysaccharide heptosyltransferase family protein n=1 Tax=Shewanella maritima TaxID=2520507 RepID=A0A411PHY4_9GAMM|nr:glycosyltransferase family 9 protein [Shewanella maritima]QBF83153.1 lipopolysaccharide heptosyltransferase family protein [Shewanella maritima]